MHLFRGVFLAFETAESLRNVTMLNLQMLFTTFHALQKRIIFKWITNLLNDELYYHKPISE